MASVTVTSPNGTPIYTQDQVNKNLDTGTNGPTITTAQSQAVTQTVSTGPIPYQPPATSFQTFDDGSSIQTFDDGSTLAIGTDGTASATNATDAVAPLNAQPAAAAPGDDNSNGANTVSGTSVLLNAATSPTTLITPQPNILDQFASYTYNIGWYLLTPTQFSSITNAVKIDVNQWSLLVQSGGASSQQTAATQQGALAGQSNNITGQLTTTATTGRNKYFTLDYYIDDLEISSTLGGGGPATLTELSFKVTEPNGLTLLPNLTNAVRDLYQQTNAANNLAFFCIVVKFYGWDINGHLITDPSSSSGTPGATPGITNAVLTRYYPFQITEFNFKMASKAIEYQIKGVPQHFQYGSSSGTASIPYNIELTGATVGDVLSGAGISANTGNTTGSGRDATTTSSPTVQTGPTKLTAQEVAASQLATVKNFIFNPFGASNSQTNGGWGEG